ncbi:MAG: DUF3576 domain-containing protein [Pseudomonadota bacterium]
MSLSRVSPALVVVLMALSACSSLPQGEAKYPTGARDQGGSGDAYEEEASIFGKDGLDLFGRKKDESEVGIGVNTYLWRAALDTISFMPMASADPFGGVILTDWYQPDAERAERYKLNVLIHGRALQASALNVTALKQVRTNKGWVDAPADAAMSRQIEDAILLRARQLRVASQDN